MRYKTNQEARQALLNDVDSQDKNFCTVIALAQVTDCTISKAWHKLKELGRKRRQGTRAEQYLKALDDMQYSYDDVPVEGKTVNQFTKICDKNATYLIRVRGHVLVIRGGLVRDWSAGRTNRRKITGCWKCYKKIDTITKTKGE